MNRRRRRDGYILLMTLVLIAITGLLMAGMARRSMQLALDAAEAQQQLQQRWGGITCQRYAFQHADRLLSDDTVWRAGDVSPLMAQEESGASQPPLATRLKYASFQLELGGVRFDLLLADENAKANLNTIYERRDRTFLYQALQRMSGVQAHLPIHLRPAVQPEQEARQTAFRSWGQIFDMTSEEARQVDVADVLAESSRHMTCWGNGRLHFAVASDESVREVAGLAISRLKVGQLLEARREQPGRGFQALLPDLELTQAQGDQLLELLADNSFCQSLWLTISTGAARETSFIVRESDAEGNAQVSVWEW